MGALGAYKTTGRRITGSAADLVEVETKRGNATALVFHPEYRDHASLRTAIGRLSAFLTNPGVDGLVPMVGQVPEEGAYVFDTETAWSLAEIVRVYADFGEACGARAGLELAYQVVTILDAARMVAIRAGAPSHSSLDPWRIFVQIDGSVHIVGYGLPSVDVAAFREDEAQVPREDAFRYAPPERMEGFAEDVSSDLFALGLVMFEVVSGRPVYDGLVNELRQQAIRAEGGRRLHAMRGSVTDGVREVVGRAIKYDPDARYSDPNVMLWDLWELLQAGPDGPSLFDVVERVKAKTRKPASPLMGGMTGAISKAQLAALADELDDPEPIVLSPPKKPKPGSETPPPPPDQSPPRWERASRDLPADRGSAPPSPSASGSGEFARPTRRDPNEPRQIRRIGDGIRRVRGEEPAEVAAPPPPSASTPVPEPPRPRVEAPPPPPLPPPPAPPMVNAADLLSKLRSSASRLNEAPIPVRPVAPAFAMPPGLTSPAPAMPAAPEPPAVVVAPASPPPVAAAPAPAAPAPAAPAVTGVDRPGAAAEPPNVVAVVASAVPATGRFGPPAGDDTVPIDVRFPDGSVRAVDVGLTETFARVAWRLGHEAGLPVDLTGATIGWWRLVQGSNRWPGNETIDVVNPDAPVELQLVPARIVRRSFDIRGDAAPIRFDAPVSDAVPVGWIVAHLRRWLGLREGTWTVTAGGRALSEFEILDGLPDGEPLIVQS